MGRRLAQFDIAEELIKQALAMPDDAEIYNIVRHGYRPGTFVFVVEHPDFDELIEGEMPPSITPTIEADYEKRPATWLTFSWGE